MPSSGKALRKFTERVNFKYGAGISDYLSLWEWSTGTQTAPLFWLELVEFLGIKFDSVPRSTFEEKVRNLDRNPIKQFYIHLRKHYLMNNPGPKWRTELPPMYPPPAFFPSVKMNFAENIFANYESDKTILCVASEGETTVRNVTWKELHGRVARAASAMVSHGAKAGDRVAAVISNRLVTIVACLAVLSLGGIWSSSSPDMGVDAILSRLKQIRPKMVICEHEIVYNGKLRHLLTKHLNWAKTLAQDTSELEAVIVVGGIRAHEGDLKPFSKSSLSQPKLIGWNEFLAQSATHAKLSFRQLPFNHPGFIVYSSGTTGPPKCIVHSAGGLLVSASKDGFFSYDVHKGDTLLQYSTTAWIMWAFVLASLSFGGKAVVYDGSPLIPDPLVLLRLAASLKVNVFGTSAKFLSLLKDKNISPREQLDLTSLRTVVSTGSILPPDVAEWFYDRGFPPNVFLNSTCGGTDLACALITGAPTLPLHAGEIQAPSLGMSVDVFDMDANAPLSVQDTGNPGELVCKQTWPSEPVSLWADQSGDKYRSSYFAKYASVKQSPEQEQLHNRPVWNQGDFVSKNPATGGFLVHGRSDGVLNPGGIRFGSAEIYSIIAQDPAIADSVCVGQRRERDVDESVILFVQMVEGHKFSRAVAQRLSEAIRSRLSPHHVPRYMFQVYNIPHTMNGKKVEMLVKDIVSGRDVKVSPTVVNPECLDFYKQFINTEEASARQQLVWEGHRAHL